MNGVLASDLDTYLWRLGKKGNFRQVERHITTDTVYY